MMEARRRSSAVRLDIGDARSAAPGSRLRYSNSDSFVNETDDSPLLLHHLPIVARNNTRRRLLVALNIGVLLFLLFRPPRDTSLSTSLGELRTAISSFSSDSLRSSPAQSCELCVADPTNPLCTYGIDNVRLSRSYEGSGYRVRKVLEKAMAGEAVSIGIIGASVTAGHGLLPGELPWQDVFLTDFVKVFPKTTVHRGIVPGMTSGFFSYCWSALLPESLDMYIIELDINNEASDETYKNDDELLRGLLQLPQQPAVLRVSVLALMFSDLVRGAVSNFVTSQFFDIPVVGVRNILLPHLFLHPNETRHFFSHQSDGPVDGRHLSALGHQILGDMLAIYIRDQTCLAKQRRSAPPALPDSKSVLPQSDILGSVPPQYFWHTFDPSFVVPKSHPNCQLMQSDLSPLKVVKSSGDWKYIEWQGRKALASSEIGSRITFGFEGHRLGMFVWSSNGAAYPVRPGMLRCWFDDDYSTSTLIDAWKPSDVGGHKWAVVAGDKKLKVDHHTVTCEIARESSTGDHEVRILGLGSQ